MPPPRPGPARGPAPPRGRGVSVALARAARIGRPLPYAGAREPPAQQGGTAAGPAADDWKMPALLLPKSSRILVAQQRRQV